jgi:hypothetical protein
MGHKMFLLTLVKYVPFQLFPLLQNVLFDQASFVSFHLLSYGGGGDLSNVLFQLGQIVPSHLCLWGRGISNVLFKPGQIVPSHLCLWGRGNFKCSF